MSNLFFCDYCNIEKFNSETQEYERVAFECKTKHNYIRHINNKKHIINTLKNNHLEDEEVTTCKHCTNLYAKDQYKLHQERNNLSWGYKGRGDMYSEISCNNFIYSNKRFNNVRDLKDYIESQRRSRYWKTQEKKQKILEKGVKFFDSEAEFLKKIDEKRAEQKRKIEEKRMEKKKKQEEKENKKKEPIVKNIEMVIEDEVEEVEEVEEVVEEEYDDETPVERERNDCNIPPILDDEDKCANCNLYQNYLIQYKQEKLDRYNIKICECPDSDDTDSD
tara:strand:- start:719 stop:1549 length:831 start_codon:yes stop_codon:yes gene_type:complete